MKPTRLTARFFTSRRVEEVARRLIGCRLCTCIQGTLTAGVIVETEAYGGGPDRASHADGGRRTARTDAMFAAGGHAYIYLCYGLHTLFNIVTGPEGEPAAVLIRALAPAEGVEAMNRRRPASSPHRLASGPGALTRALGITLAHNRTNLVINREIWLEPRSHPLPPNAIAHGTRVGVGYAGADALRPWRFALRGSPCVSPAVGAGGDHPCRPARRHRKVT